MKVRASLLTQIFNKVLTVDLNSYAEGPGKINNLISVDINNITGEFIAEVNLEDNLLNDCLFIHRIFQLQSFSLECSVRDFT